MSPPPAARTLGMVRLPGGRFLMGSDRFYPEERPQHPACVGPLWIDPAPVTNADFARFAQATGYLTRAERDECGSLVFRTPALGVAGPDWRLWWSSVPGACWRHPEGAGSNIDTRMEHPVVHVCWHDAQAYARWAGKQLPTEAQWEYAARGGVHGAEYAWGDEAVPAGPWRANTWQGQFPVENLALDGWAGTSPVGSFAPNGFGLLDMIGNAWEWTLQPWSQDHRTASPTAGPSDCCGVPSSATPAAAAQAAQWLVLKGGSHLCADNYCLRYRPAARIPLTADTATSHVGFRCVVEA